ncbi:MAG TPA: macro domain-containing protein [Thermomicrobiales bacterium]|nr:macro domain-containing protein [Thermomicrobiales bacterium]
MNRTIPPANQSEGVRFGRTIIVAATGDLFDHDVEAIVTPANRRGVMGAGFAGRIRLAGGIEIEREAMAQAPLAVGTAVATTSGDLGARGIRTVIHAVVSDGLGAPTRLDIVRSATSAALREADRQRVRTVLVPLLGAGLGTGRLPGGTVSPSMIEEMVAHFRRFTCRLDRVVFHLTDAREAETNHRLLLDARDLWWGITP